MSMWEVEALIENAVNVINKSNIEPSEKRNLIWNGYQLQNEFDCGDTQFRVKDILLECEYLQPYTIDDFPMRAEYPEIFDTLKDEESGSILENPVAQWDEDNPSVAYWDQDSQFIYVTFASKFYTLYPKEKPIPIAPLDFALQIIEMANKQQDKSSVYAWVSFMLTYLLMWLPPQKPLEALKTDYFMRVKDIYQQFDFSDVEPLNEMMDLSSDAIEEFLNDEQIALIHFVTSQ